MKRSIFSGNSPVDRSRKFWKAENTMAEYLINEINFKHAAFRETSFSRFYQEYQPKIYNYVYFKTNESADVEDLTSRILEKVFTNLGKYDESAASLNTWIFTIAKNQIIDYYRQKRVGEAHFENGEELMVKDEITPKPEDAAVKGEREEIIAGLLEELPENEREILVLKFWGGLKNIEIAEQLGIHANNVNVIVFRTLRKLKDTIDARKIEL